VQTKTLDPLPKTLPGVVCRQWVRCGRQNCCCTHGKLHGPFFYRFWREGGKLRKQYVPAEKVDEVRSRCEARREARRTVRAGWETWRNLLAVVREVERGRNDCEG
jgi:hypothetical protein